MKTPDNPVTPALLRCREVARLLGCSVRTVARMSASGAMPRPIRVGCGLVRWSRDALLTWIERGCPNAGDAEPVS